MTEMTEWIRFTEVELTNAEEQRVIDYGFERLTRDGQYIELLAETDTDCTYGVACRTGEFAVLPAGRSYQSTAHSDFYELASAAVAQYGGTEIADFWAQSYVVRLPYDRAARRRLLAALRRIEAQSIAEYVSGDVRLTAGRR